QRAAEHARALVLFRADGQAHSELPQRPEHPEGAGRAHPAEITCHGAGSRTCHGAVRGPVTGPFTNLSPPSRTAPTFVRVPTAVVSCSFPVASGGGFDRCSQSFRAAGAR